MRTKIISQDKTETVVTLEEAMEHSRITDTYDELVCQSTLEAATDLAEKWLNRKLYPTEMVGAIQSYRSRVTLPYPTVHSVSKVTAEDANGNEYEFVEGTDYKFDEISEEVRFLVKPVQYNQNFKFYFAVGFQTPDDIPMGIKHAIKQIFATLYENREDTVIAASVSEVPLKSTILLKPYRAKVVA